MAVPGRKITKRCHQIDLIFGPTKGEVAHMRNRILFGSLLFLTGISLQAQDVSSSVFGNGEGVNGGVFAIVVQPDGKIVIGGDFSAVNGIPCQNIARLNKDGSLDQTFAKQYTDGANGMVYALAILPGKGVIVGGAFTEAGNQSRANVALYKFDGTLDSNFGSSEGGQVTNGAVRSLAVQPDGKIILGGNFTAVYGKTQRSLARLNNDSTLDETFSPQNVLTGSVNAVAFSSGVLAGGNFSAAGKVAPNIFKAEN